MILSKFTMTDRINADGTDYFYLTVVKNLSFSWILRPADTVYKQTAMG